jgi:adenosylmethionine-8-amino-7-oxononanoate aminotransferase
MDAMQSAVLHRDLQRTYPTIVRGEGIYLFDDAGKRYIDGSGGSAAVTAIGHGVPEVVDAMTAQATRLAYAPTHAFTTDAVEECARLIIEEFAPPGFSKVWFVSGGSEATDNAVKMAIQYQRMRGEGSRHLVIGRWMSYHGGTIAALAYGGNSGRRRLYSGVMPAAEHIPPCNPYRCWANSACPGCDLSCADALERTIRQVGAENVAAFIAEPIVGATLGAVPATPGYFQRIREICNRYGVVLIADEVMTGFGRTGRNFGIEHWGVTPDLITCAKGIAGGYTPLGAVLARPEFVDEVARRGSSFVIGHTSSGNPLSCAVGTAVLRYVRDHDLVANAARQGEWLMERLRDVRERHPMIGDVRGMGLLCGIEFVSDQSSRTPFPPSLGVSRRIGQATLERGLISYPGSGTVDGQQGDHLLYAPPLTISRQQVDELVSILDESLSAVGAELNGCG